MSTEKETQIAALLRETESAHGDYETNILGGKRDEDWAAWYSAHLLENGLADFFPRFKDTGAEDLPALLVELDAGFRREQPSIGWPEYYARRLIVAPA